MTEAAVSSDSRVVFSNSSVDGDGVQSQQVGAQLALDTTTIDTLLPLAVVPNAWPLLGSATFIRLVLLLFGCGSYNKLNNNKLEALRVIEIT